MCRTTSAFRRAQLAAEMIERALEAGVPFRWVGPIASMGSAIRGDLRQAGKGYVLGVNSNHRFASWGKPQRIGDTPRRWQDAATI